MKKMREIKFRCWDNVTKRMVYNSPTMVIRLSGKVTDGSTTPDVVLMQYTGTKDRIGNEIYEGDIVDFDDEPKEVLFGWFTVWIDGLGSQEFYGFHINTEDGFGNEMAWPIDSYVGNVIGNTYENSELLKETE